MRFVVVKRDFSRNREPAVCRSRVLVFFVVMLAAPLLPGALVAERIPVRYVEGVTHGFLVLRTADGKRIADGDLAQEAHGNRVSSRLTFHFSDGSLYEETTEFSQRRQFRLLRDHVVQKGPSFKHTTDTSIDATRGTVSIRYTEDGKEKTLRKRMKLPADLANGMVFTLLKNVRPGTAHTTLSYLVTTPQPRLVKLDITPAGEDRFTVGKFAFQATHYVVKINIGGITGVVAKVIGEQPADRHIWILADPVPAFIRFEGPLEEGGADWSIELTSPNWPKQEGKR
jgi:hypothetical protein